jgi:hypothetical protein
MKKTIARLLSACLALIPATTGVFAAAAPPRVVAADLWKDVEGYQKWWVLWPKTQPMHPGTAPHGAFLSTYVNEKGRRSVDWKEKPMLETTMILLESYDADRHLVAVSLMRKVEGFNPDAGDWFWAEYGPNGGVRAEGKVEACIQCHGKQAENDYIFTAPLKETKQLEPSPTYR